MTEFGCITRRDIEVLTGLTRTGATTLVNNFVNQGVFEKRGNSTAIRYFLTDQKSVLFFIKKSDTNHLVNL